MSTTNKQIAEKFIRALGAGDIDAVKSLMTPDTKIVTRGHSKISVTHNYDAILNIAKAFPLVTRSGIRFEILNLTAEADRVACEAEGFSTMMDGSAYNNHYHFLIFIRDDKVCRMNEYLDTKLADAMLGPYLAAA